MVQKGIIRAIDLGARRAYVNIPIFQNAASTAEVIFCCPFSYQPGSVCSYSIDDIVYVGFENNDLEYPFILGKLYTKSDDGNSPTAFNGNSLTITGKTVLSDDTKIGDITYDKLMEIIAKTDALSENVDNATAAIQNLTNTSNTNQQSSSGSVDLGKIAYNKVLELGERVDDLDQKVQDINELLKDLLYADPEYIISPTWKLEQDGYKLYCKVKNVDEKEDHVEYLTTNLNWIPYDYCHWGATPHGEVSEKRFTSDKIEKNSEVEHKFNDAWINDTWSNSFGKDVNGNINKAIAFPQLWYNNSEREAIIPKSILSVSTNAEGTARAYGTSRITLDLDMTNRKKSKVNITPENTGLTFKQNAADIAETTYQSNMWYKEPAIITAWDYDWKGEAKGLFDASAEVEFLRNDIYATCRFSFTVGNIKRLPNLESSNIRILLKFSLDGVARYTSSQDSSEAEIYQEVTFDKSEFFYVSGQALLHNVTTKSEKFDLEVTNIIQNAIAEKVSGGKDILTAIVAKSIQLNGPCEGSVDADRKPWYSNVSLSNIIIEYYYVADANANRILGRAPVSLPICYNLMENGEKHEGSQLLNLYSNYEAVVGESGIIPAVKEGGTLRDPEVVDVKLIKITDAQGKTINTSLSITIKNTNYLDNLKQDENTDIALNSDWKLKLALYSKSNGEKDILIGDKGIITVDLAPQGSKKPIITNAFYKNTTDSGEFITDPDKWIVHPTYLTVQTTLQQNIDFDKYLVAMKAIQFTEISHPASDFVLIESLDWTTDQAPAKLKKKSAGDWTPENCYGALKEQTVKGNPHTITYQIPAEYSQYITAPSTTTGYFSPIPLPEPSITDAGKVKGYEFKSWRMSDNTEFLENQLLTSDITVSAVVRRKTERIYFNGIQSGTVKWVNEGTGQTSTGKLNATLGISYDLPYGDSVGEYLANTTNRSSPIPASNLNDAKEIVLDEVATNNFTTNPTNSTTSYMLTFDYYYWSIEANKLKRKKGTPMERDYNSDSFRYFYTRGDNTLVTDFNNEKPAGANLSDDKKQYNLNSVIKTYARFYEKYMIIATIAGAEQYDQRLNNYLDISNTEVAVPMQSPIDPRFNITGWYNNYGDYAYENKINIRYGEHANEKKSDRFNFEARTTQVRDKVSVYLEDSSAPIETFYPDMHSTITYNSNLPKGYELYEHKLLTKISNNAGYEDSPNNFSMSVGTKDWDITYKYTHPSTRVNYYVDSSVSDSVVGNDFETYSKVHWGDNLNSPQEGSMFSKVKTGDDPPYHEFQGWFIDDTKIDANYEIPDNTSTIDIHAHYKLNLIAYSVIFRDALGSRFFEFSRVSLDQSLGQQQCWPSSVPPNPGHKFTHWELDGEIITQDSIIPSKYHRGHAYITPVYEPLKHTVEFEWDNHQIRRFESGNLRAIVPYGSRLGNVYDQAETQAIDFSNSYVHDLDASYYERLSFRHFLNGNTVVNKDTVIYGDSSFPAEFNVIVVEKD